MAYFRELPNLQYLSQLPDAASNQQYITVKNLFRRAKIRTDIINIVTAFDYYQIPDNMRPDVVAQKLYNDPELDWVILITNNITNIKDQWPLGNNDLYSFMLSKYGSDAAISQVHHYETTELRDEYNRILVPSGLVVDSTYTFTYQTLGNLMVTVAPIKAVTNYEYEVNINEQKRQIRVLKPAYLSVVVTDLRNIMKYDTSTYYINQTTKGTYNPNLTGV